MKLLILERINNSNFYIVDYFVSKGIEVKLLNLNFLEKNLIIRLGNKFQKSITKSLVSNLILNNILKYDFDKILFFNIDYLDIKSIKILKNIFPKKEILCWHGDDILNERFGKNEKEKVKFIDTHISPRKHRESEYKKLGAHNFLKVNWYSKNFKDKMVENPKYDLSFCGSYSKKRYSLLENLNYNKSILVGYGWKKHNLNFSYKKNHLSIDEMNSVIHNSRISLNFLTEENFDKTNFRNFEIPSQFSLQISEKSDELNEIFEDEKSIVFYNDKDELNDKVKFFIREENKRKKIILNSNAIIKRKEFSLEYQLDLIYNHLKI